MTTTPSLKDTLPNFNAIQAEQIVDKVKQLIEYNQGCLEAQLNDSAELSWESLVAPIEEREDVLNKTWSPISHLNNVCSSDALRKAHDEARLLLSDYYTSFGQNKSLFLAYKKLADTEAFASLAQENKTVIEHSLRDFTLTGIELEDDDKQRFAEIKARLSSLANQFSNNVLDASNAWHYQTDSLDELSGLPAIIIDGAKARAEQKKLSGYCLSLDGPVYLAVLTHADSQALREHFYKAYCTRASDVGPHAGQWDNSAIIEETLILKTELAKLIDKSHYADLSLTTKMAKDVDEVETFLRHIAEKARPSAQKDLQQLQEFARDEYAISELAPWDIAYYSEKLKAKHYSVSQEELREYFTLAKVLKGLFKVAETLFNVSIKKVEKNDLWHEDASYYEIYRDDQCIAGFYTDLYARDAKRGGAWMDVCQTRRQSENGLQLPVAYLVCNFNAPVGSAPTQLTHTEVTTLFHEFGHGLHHMLTQINVAGVSGITGVEWDAVELPSQFLENWAWQPQVLKDISEHCKSKEALPDALIEKLIAAKNFQTGLFLLRQIEFALFDIIIHRDFGTAKFKGVQACLNQVREQIALIPVPDYNRFQNSFSHIFAGGYAAGYYSYLWAEVLSADAFSEFKKRGIFDRQTGERFLSEILSRGGSRPASELFENFMGRQPEVQALLDQCGIR